MRTTMLYTASEIFRRCARATVAIALLASPAVRAQDTVPPRDTTVPKPAQQPPANPQQPPDDGSLGPVGDPGVNAEFAKQRYRDSLGRFGFSPPPNWGRLPSKSPDEVTFQNDYGDNIRIVVEPLKMDREKLLSTFADTYLNTLAETFEDIRYLGQRAISLSGAESTDFVFTGTYKNIPVTCHSVVLVGQEKVLYITFAAYGSGRQASEQYFFATLLSFWIAPAFTRATITTSADPNAPAFTMPIPEEWVEQPQPDPNLRVFRPPGARPTSASITTRVLKPLPTDKFTTVDGTFTDAWKDRLQASYTPGTYALRVISPIMLGGQPGVRFDYSVVTNEGTRRIFLALSMHKGYIVGIACESAEQGFSIYEKTFERTLGELKFQ